MKPATRIGIVAACLCLDSLAYAFDVRGHVTDSNGEGLPFVRLRVTVDGSVPYSTSVFTNAQGEFHTPALSGAASSGAVDAFRIGWQETAREESASASTLALQITMSPLANVAEQVPASAWLHGDRDSIAYQMTTLHCSNCHQLGAERVKRFAETLKPVESSDRAESWLKRAAEDLKSGDAPLPWQGTDPAHGRVAAWEAMVQYMRWATMRLGEHKELRWGLKEGTPYYDALLNPATSLFAPRDMAIIIPNLAHAFPTEFDTYTGYNDVERLGAYAVNEQTVIEEFVLPTFGWTREIALAAGSPLVWFVETDKDRLGSLDPKTGGVEWYDIPLDGQQGPHTMNADASGNLWIALEDSFHIAKFDTHSKRWRLYDPPAGTNFGVTHDFAFNSDRHVEPDAAGRIWITDLGKNELWGVNIDSGEIKTYRMPLVAGETNFHTLLYGAAIDVPRKRVWWAQLYGMVGAFDTEHNTVARVIPFSRGAGPRRLAIQEDGIVWVPLFGASELAKIDGESGIEIARYTIPDKGAAPYGVTLDKKRNAIWAATSNSDRIYRFDIATETWRHYPLPRKETYIRMIEVDASTGDVWTTYSSLPVGRRDVATYGIESANNMIVRLRPGD